MQHPPAAAVSSVRVAVTRPSASSAALCSGWTEGCAFTCCSVVVLSTQLPQRPSSPICFGPHLRTAPSQLPKHSSWLSGSTSNSFSSPSAPRRPAPAQTASHPRRPPPPPCACAQPPPAPGCAPPRCARRAREGHRGNEEVNRGCWKLRAAGAHCSPMTNCAHLPCRSQR